MSMLRSKTDDYEVSAERAAGRGRRREAEGDSGQCGRRARCRGLRAAMVPAVMVMALFMMVTMTGCGPLGDAAGDLVDEISGLADDLENSTYFNNYTSEDKEEEYVMKGQIHHAVEDDEDACAVWVHGDQDTEVHVTGTFEKKKKSEGNLELVYIDPDGGRMVVAGEDTGDIDLTIKVKQGDGQFRFEGENAVYNFELHFSKAEGVVYSWSGMDDVEDRLDEFEEDMDDMADEFADLEDSEDLED